MATTSRNSKPSHSFVSGSKLKLNRCRTIGRSYGEVGTGKTQFWLTGRKPIYMHSMDKGLEGTIDQMIRAGVISAKDVEIADYNWSPGGEGFDQAYAIQIRDQIEADYQYALSLAGTIVFDKESDIWQCYRYAEFGAPNDAPKDYDVLNQRYTALINEAKKYDVSLGLIQSVKDEWGLTGEINERTGKKKFGKTGQRVSWGFDRLEELVFVNIQHRREDGQFWLDIGKCRQNSSLQDQSIPGCTLSEFGLLLIEDSSEEDWQ